MKLIIITLILLSSLLLADKNSDLFIELNTKNSNKNILNNLLKERIKTYPKLKIEDFEFIPKKVQKGLTAVLYSHYAYKYKGLLVNHQTIVISSKEGKAFLITGKLDIPNIKELKSKKSGAEIFQIFNKNLNSIKFHSEIEKSLLVKNGKTHLVYKATIEFNNSKGLYSLGKIYLDSKTAKEIQFDSHIHDHLEREVYDFKNQCLINDSSYWNLPKVCVNRGTCSGVLLFDEEETHDDLDALHAFNNSGLTYWFYKNMFNRDSFDNRGIEIISTVHVRFGTERGCYGQNASFLGAPFYQMLYGNGYSRALDVVAHELTHAVTDATSDLRYQGESGALNEAMSDIFGATIEAWSDSGGTTLANPNNLAPSPNTWKIGEDIGRVMRYMDTPNKAGHPDHYSIKYTGFEDNGGVHINSSIINLSYYLLSMGGNHPRELFKGQAPDVEALGMEKAIKIFYEAQTNLFISSTNFNNARLLLSVAAENLYGVCSSESEQVNRAFDILGVPGLRRNQCIKTCEELSCDNIANSVCVEPFNQAFCECEEGFHWNIDTNLCEEDYICYFVTCGLKNSHCEEFNGEGICVCDEGYELNGQVCSKIQTDPCSEIPCENGICENNKGAATCKCNSGFELSNNSTCIKYVSPCNDVSCSNNGNCIVKSGKALCTCFDGYHSEGLTCVEDELDLCENVTCSYNGTCTVSNDKASCVCKSGYTAEGLNCIEETNNDILDKNDKGSSSSCNYQNTENSSYILFLIMGIFLIFLRKKNLDN